MTISCSRKRNYLSIFKKIIKRNNIGDFYCLNCVHYFRTDLNPIKYVKIKIFVKALKYQNIINIQNLIFFFFFAIFITYNLHRKIKLQSPGT